MIKKDENPQIYRRSRKNGLAKENRIPHDLNHKEKRISHDLNHGHECDPDD